MKNKYWGGVIALLILAFVNVQCDSSVRFIGDTLEEGFKSPPKGANPGVYWYFMDGNLSKEGITKDLESMVQVGISHAIFLEVNAGVPRGKVDMLSPEWMDIFKHMVSESERLGVRLSIATGPGWAGTGGPWVDVEESMQHLVASTVVVNASDISGVILPKPVARKRFYGDFVFTPEQRKDWENFYEDVAVLAFPTPEGDETIVDTDEKALYGRHPFSSMFGVKQFLPTSASYPEAEGSVVNPADMIDLTSRLRADGSIEGTLPEGRWTIMRFGVRNTGAVTSPAPAPGLGFETDKMDTTAISHHLNNFVGEIFRYAGFQKRTSRSPYGGLAMLHFDSWEMGSQNWTSKFREEFKQRRKYDPQPFYPAYTGVIVGSRELTERILWDLRKTIQELILENHLGYIRQYAHEYGLGLSIEPYDMTPVADLELAAAADVPMCEFWRAGFGFNTTFSLMEATSVAHLKGQPVVPAESFTALNDGWDLYPGQLKNQTDWALASGVNRMMFHTFVHQCFPDSVKPGMTMGGIGVQWNRNQTWWEMSKAYHDYLSRSQFLLQQGRTVSDILYFCPEGNPHVFKAPVSAYNKPDSAYDVLYIHANTTFEKRSASENQDVNILPDKRGYAFDACPPSLLYKATVKDGRIIFPSGAEYSILVLPNWETMTPDILKKIKELVIGGATVVGMPPKKSPSLQNYPQCDNEIKALVKDIWGEGEMPITVGKRMVGKGQIIWGQDLIKNQDNLYPDYDCTASILSDMNIPEDFTSNGALRYTHRTVAEYDIYFVSNRSGKKIQTDCIFRVDNKIPELWDAVTGEIRDLKSFSTKDGQTIVPMQFDIDQSFFVVFRKKGEPSSGKSNFSSFTTVLTLDKPWSVSFDPSKGGAEKVVFDKLTDWSTNENDSIKFYSGTGVYRQTFDMKNISDKQYYLHLGEVNVIAKVWLNKKEIGTVWTYPWQLNISDYIKLGENQLEIEVINPWVNRLIGDKVLSDGGVQKHYTSTTYQPYNKESPLLKSGLLGPVRILEVVEKSN